MEIKTLQDLETFVNKELDYIHEIRMGRKDISWDDYFKGLNVAYINIHNALVKIKENSK